MFYFTEEKTYQLNIFPEIIFWNETIILF